MRGIGGIDFGVAMSGATSDIGGAAGGACRIKLAHAWLEHYVDLRIVVVVVRFRLMMMVNLCFHKYK